MSKVFGIDLGTTYSCIAYIDENGKPVVLKNAEGDLTTNEAIYNVRQYYFTEGEYLKYEKNYALLKDSSNYKMLNSIWHSRF